MIEAYHARTLIDRTCADDLLPYVPFTVYTATGDVVKVVYIIIVTPSCLDSTICHSSCLNCALYIFDKAAQDQMIGVTGHD